MKMGLQPFVMEIVALLNDMVGDAWLRGEVDVPAEHLYTEQLKGILRTAIAARSGTSRGRPAVLLTTFPEEQHALGLLMVEAMLTPEGACCVSLGADAPRRHPQHRNRRPLRHRCAVVQQRLPAASRPRRAAQPARRPAAPNRTLGGRRRPAHGRPQPPGIRVFAALDDIPAALAEWRRNAAPVQP